MNVVRAAVALTFALSSVGMSACDDGETPSPSTVGNSQISCSDNVCRISAGVSDPLTGTITLTKDNLYLLQGGVFVGNDVDESVLNIEAGTQIFGETASKAFLVIRRNSKILAEGTKDEPIVMTSSAPEGERQRGDWGGLVINGKAPINGCDAANCEAEGEGGTGKYGGDVATDSSGVLRYVRVEFAGNPITPDNELNGIAFQGVGSGTTIEYVQVHMAADDGIEFFGGTAQFKYVLTTGISDDNLDWTDGWTGKGQFFVAQQYDDAGDQGIEADNNGDANAALPRSNPQLANLTLIGSPDSTRSDAGILLREGTGASIMNTLVVGFNEACIDIDHNETWNNGLPTISNSLVQCATHFERETWNCDDADKDADAEECTSGTVVTGDFKEDWVVEDWFTGETSNVVADFAGTSVLADPFNVASPGLTPASGATLPTAGDATAWDAFFTATTFVGGVDPANDWTAGWTTSATN